MSTYINTNTTASMASMNLNMNSNKLSTDIEQLSTGLRINDASDDPAGLVVSENYKSQLAGLNQATANSNDAINETKTAESALNQVQNLLISMRQLAVQASNAGVNDQTDVQADQTQIASAIQSINRIAQTTQFGTKFLLNGSATSALTTSGGSATVSGGDLSLVSQGTWSAGNAFNYTSASLGQVSNATVTVGTTDVGGGTPTANTSSNTTFTGSIAINGTTYTLANDGTDTTNLNGLNTAIAASGYQASFNGTGNLVLSAQAGGPVDTPSVDASSLTISGSASSIAATATDATNTSTFASASGTGGALSSAATTTVSGQLSLNDSTAGISFSKTYAPGTTLAQVQKDLNTQFGTGATKVTASISSGALVFTGKTGDTLTSTGSSFSAFNSAVAPAASTFTNGTNPTLSLSDASGDTLKSTSTQNIDGTYYYQFGNGLMVSSSVAASTTGTTALHGGLSATAGSTTKGVNLEYQIGANSGQTDSLSIGSIDSDQLGTGAAGYTDANGNAQTVATSNVGDINVSTFKGAQDAIQVLDQAISQVSTVRANLGSFTTNVLQSNVTSLGVAQTNLQASESTKEDADMAATIVDYTKNQILVSASTSALSYANQMPQSILKLLQ